MSPACQNQQRGRIGRASDTSAADLLAGAAAGDRRSWDEIVARYARLVRSVAYSFRLTSADAADVTQATWLRLVENLGTIRDPERLGAWLATTARREAIHLLRRDARDVAVESVENVGSGALPVDVAYNAPIEQSILDAERNAELWTALETLPSRCRELLTLLLQDPPVTYDEAAVRLGIRAGSVGPARTRCLDMLRQRMAHLENDRRRRLTGLRSALTGRTPRAGIPTGAPTTTSVQRR